MRKFSPVVPVDIITCEMVTNIWDLQAYVANHTKIYPKGLHPGKKISEKKKITVTTTSKNFQLDRFSSRH